MSEQVRVMFNEIASKYDLMNDVLSFGIHRLWKKKFVKLLNLKSNDKILDLASGTGDIAFEEHNYTKNVTASDFCNGMLSVAKERAKERNIDITFMQIDALNIPFEADTFDASTISFGIRNVDDVSQCLREMARICKPDSKVAIMEFGQPKGLFGAFYKLYSKYVIPRLGKTIAHDCGSYTYLEETAARFPAGDKFLKIMDDTHCFSSTKAIKLSMGIAYIYVGVVK